MDIRPVSPTLEERIQEAIRNMNAFAGAMVLFDPGGQVIHANEKARAFFGRPFSTRQDLPEEVTNGLDEAVAKGQLIYSCYRQAAGGPVWRSLIFPEYLDATQPERPACVSLSITEKTQQSVPYVISRRLVYELNNVLNVLSTGRWVLARQPDDPGLQADQKAMARCLEVKAERVSNILAAVTGLRRDSKAQVARDSRAQVTVGSVIANAERRAAKFNESQYEKFVPMQLLCEGPADLCFTTASGRLEIMFAEILTDITYWSRESCSVRWAEDATVLGVPAVRIEFVFRHLNLRASYGTTANEGLGFAVAEQITLDAQGRMEVTPGKPATLCLWLPLALPEGF
jgi:PAS domain-containing protein